MTMTKADITTQVARNMGMGITKADTGEVLDAILSVISSAFAQGEKIEMRGFGVFKVEQRKGRVARNPLTGQAIRVPLGLSPRSSPPIISRTE